VLDGKQRAHPINAYGASSAHRRYPARFRAPMGCKSVIFRYFNVGRCDPEGESGREFSNRPRRI